MAVETLKNKYKLNNKQYSFVQEYVSNGFNGTKAALAVYCCKNENVAAVNSYNLLRNPKIKKALKEEIELHFETHNIRKDDIIREICTLSLSDVTDYIEDDNKGGFKLKKLEKLGYKTKAIKEIKVTPKTEGDEIVFKLHSKEKPLEMISKYLGIFEDDDKGVNDINVNINLYEKDEDE